MSFSYKNYNPGFPEISRYIRFSRARNRCELCGAKNYKPHPLTKRKVVLATGHLDHNTRNDAPENLKAMCQLCHNRHDAKNRALTRALKRVERLGLMTVCRRRRMERGGQLSIKFAA
jgi:hypothetical protein